MYTLRALLTVVLSAALLAPVIAVPVKSHPHAVHVASDVVSAVADNQDLGKRADLASDAAFQNLVRRDDITLGPHRPNQNVPGPGMTHHPNGAVATTSLTTVNPANGHITDTVSHHNPAGQHIGMTSRTYQPHANGSAFMVHESVNTIHHGVTHTGAPYQATTNVSKSLSRDPEHGGAIHTITTARNGQLVQTDHRHFDSNRHEFHRDSTTHYVDGGHSTTDSVRPHPGGQWSAPRTRT